MSDAAPIPSPKMLGVKEVAGIFGVSALTVRKWSRSDDFPSPLKPAGRRGRLFWPSEIIDAYRRGRGAAS